jgi:type VI secretion system protein ImpF
VARSEVERTAQPSLLDRLTDLEPRSPGDVGVSLSESVRRAKASLRRDLEWLLNTRRTSVPVPDGLEEVRRSVFVYGIPDVSSLSYDDADDRAHLLQAMEHAIRTFEPRLADVQVRLVEDVVSHRRELHFVIEATFLLDPTPERVLYDTVLDLTRGDYALRGDGA